MALRPGLAKAHAPPLLTQRRVLLARVHEGALRDWIALADVVSEGAERVEEGRRCWFGSTSILLDPSRATIRAQPEWLVRVLAADPHLRLEAVRIAAREARARARVSLGTIQTELSFASSARGVSIEVDVMAEALSALRDTARRV